MAKTLDLQLTRRLLRPNILDYAPVLKCFVYQLQQMNGDYSKTKDEVFTLPSMSFEEIIKCDNGNGVVAPQKTYSWLGAARLEPARHSPSRASSLSVPPNNHSSPRGGGNPFITRVENHSPLRETTHQEMRDKAMSPELDALFQPSPGRPCASKQQQSNALVGRIMENHATGRRSRTVMGLTNLSHRQSSFTPLEMTHPLHLHQRPSTKLTS